MKIYIAHSRNFDFQQELYDPLKKSFLSKEHAFIFPHSENGELFNSKELFQKGCDLIIAEVSYPSTGLGIELGWADMLKVPIVCMYKGDLKVSDSFKAVAKDFFVYSLAEDMVVKMKQVIQKYYSV